MDAMLLRTDADKKFNTLRYIFATGHAASVLHFFIPSMSVRREIVLVGQEQSMLSGHDVACNLFASGHVGPSLILFGLFLLSIGFVVVPFWKPLRAVFIAGAVQGLAALILVLITGTFVEERDMERVIVSVLPFSKILTLFSAATALLGFVIAPPASAAANSQVRGDFPDTNSESDAQSAMSLPRSPLTSDTAAGSNERDSAGKATTIRPAPLPEGPPVAVWVGLGVMCLLIIGAIFASGGFASQQPLAVSFRDSYVPGGGRVLVVKNTGSVLLQDCEVQVKAGNGQSFGPKRLGSLAAGEESELGWAELDGWVLEKGETITLSSRGYADKRIVVP